MHPCYVLVSLHYYFTMYIAQHKSWFTNFNELILGLRFYEKCNQWKNNHLVRVLYYMVKYAITKITNAVGNI